ncbi:hypothetical protein [Streptomyces arenae]|uniref:hypothetical protein n=1 Tax=Streptomyces arenae TaxID=29301 RepID=UPI00265AF79C|nr:hypothetical protein [Streptomyces arenae]MCG7209644.1 hypothetical protein [Streptomyces arenae]
MRLILPSGDDGGGLEFSGHRGCADADHGVRAELAVETAEGAPSAVRCVDTAGTVGEDGLEIAAAGDRADAGGGL